MKKKIAAILIICLFYISPLHADYSSMNKAWENYTPPEYYTHSLAFKASPSESTVRSDNKVDAVFSQITILKQHHEKSIQTSHKIFFLSDQDTETFKRLTDIASDQEKVARLVKDHLSLPQIQIIAGIRNPSILEAQKKVRAELESFNQVMDLDENLKQYSAFTEDLNTRVGPVKMKESISQKFPFPGLTSFKGRVIDQQVAILVEKMKIAQKNSITDIRQAYWNIVFIDQSIKITSETIDAFERLKDVATTLYKSGRTSFQDIIKINIKMAELKESLVTFSFSRKNIEAQLCELLNLPADTRMGSVVISRPDKKIPPPEALFPLARQNRQELKVIQHQISKIENMIEMAESMIQEPFTLGFSRYEDEAANMVGTQAGKASFPEKTMAAMKNGSPLKPWYGIDDPWLYPL